MHQSFHTLSPTHLNHSFQSTLSTLPSLSRQALSLRVRYRLRKQDYPDERRKAFPKGLLSRKVPACGVRTGGAGRGGGGVRHLDMQNMHMKNMDIPAGPQPGSVWSTKREPTLTGRLPATI